MAPVPPWQLQGAREVAYALGIDAVTDGSGKRLAEGMRQVASEQDLYREKEHILSIENTFNIALRAIVAEGMGHHSTCVPRVLLLEHIS